MLCAICGANEVGNSTYPNVICDDCDERAVYEDHNEPWHGWPPGERPDPEDGVVQMLPDRGENPVFIDGQKCWRRYRFGGWITMMDEHNCSTLEEFYEKHGLL